MTAPSEAPHRLDHWLWAVRIYKTRSLATAACRAGSVTVDGLQAKPAREVRAGQQILVRIGVVERTLLVLGHPLQRVGAARVPEFCEDRTPPEELAKAKANPIAHFLARERGSGRPTKRDRRSLDQLFRP
jgi:ribosome-associated heat shock protein Hsp15